MPKKRKETVAPKATTRPKAKNRSFAQRFLQRLIDNPREDVYINGKPANEVTDNIFEESKKWRQQL